MELGCTVKLTTLVPLHARRPRVCQQQDSLLAESGHPTKIHQERTHDKGTWLQEQLATVCPRHGRSWLSTMLHLGSYQVSRAMGNRVPSALAGESGPSPEGPQSAVCSFQERRVCTTPQVLSGLLLKLGSISHLGSFLDPTFSKVHCLF